MTFSHEFAALVARENPWLVRPEGWQVEIGSRLPVPFVPRRQVGVHRVEEEGFPRDKATLVVGPRQAGKSSWVWRQLQEASAPPLFLSCELPAVREACRDPSAFLAGVSSLGQRPGALFLEEAQHLDEAGLFLKGLVDRRAPWPVVVTGSSSYHLRARTRESLAGRAARVRLLPFRIGEVDADVPPGTIHDAERGRRLRRHLQIGGYPGVWTAERPEEELAALVEAFVIRDASDLYRLERPDAFRTLLQLAARQVGSGVNLSEWASLASVSVPTVSSYLSIMEEAHLLVRVPVFAGGKRAELTRQPKLYFVDCGLRNRLVGDFSPLEARADAGPLLENFVLSELHKALPLGASVRWWRTKSGAEVDFVLTSGDALVAIEVKATTMKRPMLPRSARSFIEAYSPRRFYVVNLELDASEKLGQTSVRWLPIDRLWELLEACRA